MKRTTYPTKILVTLLVACCLSFTPPGNKQVIDSNKLATQYYQADAPWYLDNVPFFECSDKTIEEEYYYRWKM